MIREGKSGTQERSGDELSEGHWCMGEDKIKTQCMQETSTSSAKR